MERIKNKINDLAIFGGNPTFDQILAVSRPNIGNKKLLLEMIDDLLDRRWLTNSGPNVKELEKRIAQLLGVRHCVVVCNATIGLEIAIRALGLTGEVIVPSMTFVATAHALQWQEITPIFCDIDPETHNIDPRQVERLITPRTTGIIGVHLWGRPCNIDTLAEIADKHGLKLLYDAAHAFACSYKGQMVGNFGNAEVLSFHATKFFNTFEGGAVVTNSDELANKLKLMKNFGFVDYDEVIHIGTNGKMNEVSAAMGLASLESLDEFITINHRNYKLYQTSLMTIPGIKLLTFDETERCNYHYIILEIDENETIINRDELVKILWAENIHARRYFYPGCHRMEPYRSYFPNAGLLLPETESLVERVIALPTGTTISAKEIDLICQLIDFSVKNGQQLHGKLESQDSQIDRNRQNPKIID